MEMTKVREFISEKPQDKPPRLQFKPVVKCLMSFLGGFLLMNPFVIGQLSPFSVSLVAASNGMCTFAAGIGAVIGSLMFFDGTMAVKYVATVLLCILINSLCSRYLNKSILPIVSYINGFTCTFVISTAILAATGFEAEAFISIICEAALCSTGTYAFRKTSYLLWKGKDVSRFTTKDMIVTLFSAAIICMPFFKYKIFDFAPVCVILAFVVLTCGRLKSSVGGAIAGICIGTAIGMSGEVNFISVGYAAAGLMYGELSRKNKYYGCVGYIVPIVIGAVIDGTMVAYMTILESIIACGIMLVIPDSIFIHLSEKVNVSAPVFVKSESSEALSKRLNNASSAIAQISNCVDTVQKSLNPLTQPQLNQTVRSCWEKVCSECDLKNSCRDEIKHPTDADIEKIAQALSNGAELDEMKFPKGFYTSCYCLEEMKAELNNRYLSYIAGLGAQGKVNQMQGLMSDQFKSMADILKDIACEFDENLNVNTETADVCAAEAGEFGLNVLSANSYLDKFGRTFISLNILPPRENFNVTKLTDGLSNAIGTKLDLPELTEDENSCTLDFSQKISLNIDIGAFSRSMDDVQVCGDYFQSFRDSNGRHITVLSDGMGTGTRAAVDSAMAAELFSKLIKSGLSFDCALPIANSALLVKSEDESLATLDVNCIDLYTGRTDFLKAGAAATFIRHRGSVAALEQASLPIGILRDISFSKATAKLESGDIILMVSDGVLGETNGWIQQELKLWDKDNPNELAKFIVNSACERKLGKHRDDTTAIAIYLK
jgi:stage II sporulation protein E